ncbi:hypothetical protein LZD49_27410 [Dyadobacter sp. CY261]|uniref:hypothetical protein n=1 Tax=Dyadobacter sp. CY261 TaxID=2907203 RepID=UPI001F4800AF|nr:hypothetical protein [Dyadobacter sp. CY261]MCF0074243.1 hypothetical protein [Dyadobacter sp. CY261]
MEQITAQTKELLAGIKLIFKLSIEGSYPGGLPEGCFLINSIIEFISDALSINIHEPMLTELVILADFQAHRYERTLHQFVKRPSNASLNYIHQMLCHDHFFFALVPHALGQIVASQASPSPKELVRQFLTEVRSGCLPEKAHIFMADTVVAHQVQSEAPVGSLRTPEDYTAHVREFIRMLPSTGCKPTDWNSIYSLKNAID